MSVDNQKIGISEQDFCQFYRQHYAKFVGLVRRMVQDHDDAEDIVQFAFLKASRYRSRFRQEAAVYTWLYAIVRNATFDFIRKRNKERGNVLHLEDIAVAGEVGVDRTSEIRSQDDSPEMVVLNRQLQHFASAVLDNLVDKIDLPHHREVVRLYREGYEYSEIAAILDMPISSVATSLHNISLRKLPKLYRQYIGEVAVS